MQQYMQLGMGLVAAAAAITTAFEGLRIFMSWRRTAAQTVRT
jgi:hypothetical protein